MTASHETRTTDGLTRRTLVGAGAAATASLALPAAASGAAKPKPPDLVLLNGDVHTFDRRDRVVQAIASAGTRSSRRGRRGRSAGWWAGARA